MIEPRPELVLSTAPFVRSATGTARIMREVFICALVALAGAVWVFGVGALLCVAATTGGAVVTEWLFTRGRSPSPVRDWSAALAGLLLGLTLPPSLPLWMAFLGGVVAIGLGKLIWGGLGQNVFNPALVGRAFLQAAFPTATTTWTMPVRGDLLTIHPGQFAAPLMSGSVDGVSAATPLGLMKFERLGTDATSLFLGDVAGSLGETSALLLLVIGLWMGARRLFEWRLPVSTLLGAAVFSGLLHLADPAAFPPPHFVLLSGGLLFAAVFMVTDPVTTPLTTRGAWVFGVGVGSLAVLIRTFGGLPEGVMYAVLLMNAATPLIDRMIRPRPFGGG